MRNTLATLTVACVVSHVGAQAPVPPAVNQVAQASNSLRLTGQFPGPFQDTLIQRWQDASNGVTCYLYIPIMVPWVNQQPGVAGQAPIRQYGPNQLGSMSCVPSAPSVATGASAFRQ